MDTQHFHRTQVRQIQIRGKRFQNKNVEGNKTLELRREWV